MIITKRTAIGSLSNTAITLILSALLLILSKPTLANPASDRAFGNCVTAAGAYFETRGHQIGTVTVLKHQAQQHRIRITPAAADAEPAAIICTASRQTTAIEVIPARLAVSNSAR